MVSTLLWLVAGVVVLALLDRLLLWLEARGWIHYRRRGLSRGGAAYPSERLIVYGSLAPGRENHHQVADLRGEWTPGWITGDLTVKGWGVELGYPALRWRADGERVPAWLLCSPDLPGAWARLDAFEGASYQRMVVPFEAEAGGMTVGYVYAAAQGE